MMFPYTGISGFSIKLHVDRSIYLRTKMENKSLISIQERALMDKQLYYYGNPYRHAEKERFFIGCTIKGGGGC